MLTDNDFYIGYNAIIILVPEPSTLLLLGLAAVMVRRLKNLT
ncbi:MAG: PEP-CTERM sorting domain-containing protein [Promethearchaeota archaeon]